MKVLYIRVSTVEQKTDRQKVNEKDYQLVIEDKCSGVIPFFERQGGREVQNLTERKVLSELHVWQIDRLGRGLRDIINTIHYFTQKGICIHFVSQGLRSLQADGKENPISKMIISILGVVGQMERQQIKERQLEGIKIAKLKGVYLGRKKGTNENTLDFLSKPKNKKPWSI
jgi:DNA invertase Pin-like site-specific DNA recombinase